MKTNATGEHSIEVVIVEDDREIRESLTVLIDGTPGLRCRRSYRSCEEAMESMAGHPPDVVLMDIGLPGISGIEGVRLLKGKLPEVDFLMLTVQEDDESVFQSLCAGATGYLIKNTPPSALLQSIRDIHVGGSPISATIARRVILSFQRTEESPLTARESEILQLLCDGDNYRTIADKLFVSGNTVRAHIKNIYRKLHVNSRAEAVNVAIRNRLV